MMSTLMILKPQFSVLLAVSIDRDVHSSFSWVLKGLFSWDLVKLSVYLFLSFII
jgi:hypothetical protein